MKNASLFSLKRRQRGIWILFIPLTLLGTMVVGGQPGWAQSIPTEVAPPPSNTPPASSETAVSVAKSVRLGDDRYAQADYKGAVEAYTQALAVYKLNAYALYNRANAYRQLEDYEAAIADYNLSLQIDPNNLFAHLYRGISLFDNKQPAAAISDFSKVIEQNPQHALAFQKRGESHLAKGDPGAAIPDLRKAAALYEQEGKFRKQSQVLELIKQASSAKSKSKK
ncbi:MAG: tetratricopeptide repeat protein [Acaryochloris sp. SU_5_25]|nr:tetratricopeptide repeat protein [Acaryochloris sp. SU_5_25]